MSYPPPPLALLLLPSCSRYSSFTRWRFLSPLLLLLLHSRHVHVNPSGAPDEGDWGQQNCRLNPKGCRPGGEARQQILSGPFHQRAARGLQDRHRRGPGEQPAHQVPQHCSWYWRQLDERDPLRRFPHGCESVHPDREEHWGKGSGHAGDKAGEVDKGETPSNTESDGWREEDEERNDQQTFSREILKEHSRDECSKD